VSHTLAMGSSQLRPARAGDFGAIASITNHYIATTAIHFAYDPITEDELRGQWERSGDRHVWVVAEDAGVVLGYAKSGMWRERTAYQWTCEVGLYVAADARGRGLGDALYGALLSELPRRGFRSAVACITLPNEPSVKLHEKHGFVYVGAFADAGWKQGAWHAVGWWQKPLATGPGAPA